MTAALQETGMTRTIADWKSLQLAPAEPSEPERAAPPKKAMGDSEEDAPADDEDDDEFDDEDEEDEADETEDEEKENADEAGGLSPYWV
jgi:hypothetical protein